MAEAMGD